MQTVLLFSFIGIPLSTTHCAVGSTVGVGLLERQIATDSAEAPQTKRQGARMCTLGLNFSSVNWKLLVGVFTSWIITIVFSGTAQVLCKSSFLQGSFVQAILDQVSMLESICAFRRCKRRSVLFRRVLATHQTFLKHFVYLKQLRRQNSSERNGVAKGVQLQGRALQAQF